MIESGRKSSIAIVGLLALVLCLSAAACGSGETTTREARTTVTQTAATDTSEYVSDVRDLTANAGSLNSDYRDLLEQYDAGEAAVEDLTGFAEDAAGEFEFMSGRLKQMDVPEDLGTEHQLLVSAFGKWQQFYRMQVEGLNNNDSDLLEQARDLDSQAAIEINEAIDGINQSVT